MARVAGERTILFGSDLFQRGVEQLEAKGKVETVILYRGQALVTRTVLLDTAAGPVELTVPDLPESVCGDTLFASGGKDIQIRAVRYRTTTISAAPETRSESLMPGTIPPVLPRA